MLSILNELTLQKELQNFMTNNVFRTKKVKTHQKQNKKSLPEPGIKPGTAHTPVGCNNLLTTYSTEHIECSQAILLFQGNEAKH